MARRLQLPSGQTGAVVTDVDPDSPSAAALRPGDVILSVNGKKVSNAAEAGRELQKVAVGTHRAAAAVARRQRDLRHRQKGIALIATADCDLIRERGPLTVAAFMDLALYDPTSATTPARSNVPDARAIFLPASTSARSSASCSRSRSPKWRTSWGAAAVRPRGSGRRQRTTLRRHPSGAETTRTGNLDATHAHLVEASEAARATHESTLAESADRLVSSSTMVPESFEGVLIANELLDAMPVDQVVMRENGLREVYVESHAGGLRLCEGPLSTPRLSEYFAAIGANLEPGWRADVSLAAIDWVRDASRRLTRGFIILIDYGHDSAELYSVTHSAGTLTTFAKHRSSGPESASTPWLHDPGQQDLTAHVDFTSVRRAAESEGCTDARPARSKIRTFLLALVPDRLEDARREERLALKMLVMPGGLGTTMKVMILGKGVDAPKLAGLSSHIRVT